jgi:hypothetical protein
MEPRLTLTIPSPRGTGVYGVEIPPGETGRAVVMHRAGPVREGEEPARYYLTAPRGYFDPGCTCSGGYECDCPDFANRHAGEPTTGCKHIRAALSAGLLAADPEALPVPGYVDTLEDLRTYWPALSRLVSPESIVCRTDDITIEERGRLGDASILVAVNLGEWSTVESDSVPEPLRARVAEVIEEEERANYEAEAEHAEREHHYMMSRGVF